MTFFSTPYTNPNKSASIPFNAMGVWRGTIMGVYEGPTVDVSVPRISGEYVYLNAEALVPSSGQGYSVGDTVYVSFIEGRPDDLLVLGPVFFGAGTVESPFSSYGNFYDTTIQTNTGHLMDPPQANTITLNTDSGSNGVSVVDGSKVTFEFAGVYNIDFSAQLDKTDSGTDEIEIWFAVNGVNLDWSNTKITSAGNHDKNVASWNFVLEIEADDYIELKWYSIDHDMRIFSSAATADPARPAIPSVIFTAFALGGSAGGTTLGPWVDCELVDCDAYGVGARVRKDSNGIVYMFAELQMHASGSDLFVLPAGYEPITAFSVALFFRRFSGSAAGYGQITVGYGGNGVRLTDHSGDDLGEFTQVCFGGIAYPTT